MPDPSSIFWQKQGTGLEDQGTLCPTTVTYLGLRLTKGARALGGDEGKPVSSSPCPIPRHNREAFWVTGFCRLRIPGGGETARPPERGVTGPRGELSSAVWKPAAAAALETSRRPPAGSSPRLSAGQDFDVEVTERAAFQIHFPCADPSVRELTLQFCETRNPHTVSRAVTIHSPSVSACSVCVPHVPHTNRIRAFVLFLSDLAVVLKAFGGGSKGWKDHEI